MTLLQMSGTGAVLIFMITVLRALTVHRLPKRTFLILWSVAVLRLLVPVSVPSVLSAYTLLPQMAVQAQVPETPVAQTLPVISAMPEIPETAVSHIGPEGSSISIWLLLWGVGALLGVSFFAVSYLRCRMEFRTSLPVENKFAEQWCREHRLLRTIRIRQLDKISAPLTYGVLRPVILMPKTVDWAAQEQLEYVLLHEYVHIRRFDVVKKLILVLAVSLHWFNPMAWVLYALYNRDVELFCDEQVVRKLGVKVRADYARALIDLEETKCGLRPLCSGFSKTAIEERIRSIMKIKKLSIGAVLAAIVLVVGVTTVFATSAATVEDSPAEHVQADGPITAIPEETSAKELLKEYAPFGVTEENGDLYYHGELIRYFLDGYEQDETVISRHEEYNSKGTVDVHTVRRDKQNADGSAELFGPIVDIVADSQEKFDRRVFSFVTGDAVAEEVTEETAQTAGTTADAHREATAMEAAVLVETDDAADTKVQVAAVTEAVADDTEEGGVSFPELFGRFRAYGIDYIEENGQSGRGNVYYEGKPVKTFVDISPTGSFTFRSGDGGELNVQTVYDKNGTLTGLKTRSDLELEDTLLHVQAQQETLKIWEETLAPYVPFGLEYTYDPVGNDGDGDMYMSWQGKEVRGIMDEEAEIWISAHTGRSAYGTDAVELYAVYKNGVLSGLREATKAEMAEWNAQRDQAKP